MAELLLGHRQFWGKLETEISFRNLATGRGVLLHAISQIVCVLIFDDVRYFFHSTLGADERMVNITIHISSTG